MLSKKRYLVVFLFSLLLEIGVSYSAQLQDYTSRKLHRSEELAPVDRLAYKPFYTRSTIEKNDRIIDVYHNCSSSIPLKERERATSALWVNQFIGRAVRNIKKLALASFGAWYLSKIDRVEAKDNSSFIEIIGGSGNDKANSIIETSDGGLLAVGSTSSFGSGDSDMLVTKLDLEENTLWSRAIGGSDNDEANSVIETSDGGLLVVGSTSSFGETGSDILVVKLDLKGNHLWSKAMGGSSYASYDYGLSAIETSDDGFVVVGLAKVSQQNHQKVLVIKLNSEGDQIWAKTIWGGDYDYLDSVIETSNNSLVLAGFTDSFGAGNYDVLVVKLDLEGNHRWSKMIGGSSVDEARAVIETSDGGILLAGFTSSFGEGDENVLVIKLDLEGNQLWSEAIGEHSDTFWDAWSEAVIETSDGGFFLSGWTLSSGELGNDVLVVRLNSTGHQLWSKTLGGILDEEAPSALKMSDGSFLIAGSTSSFGTGDYDVLIAGIIDRYETSDCATLIYPHVTIITSFISINSVVPTVLPTSVTMTDITPQVVNWRPNRNFVCGRTLPPTALTISPTSSTSSPSMSPTPHLSPKVIGTIPNKKVRVGHTFDLTIHTEDVFSSPYGASLVLSAQECGENSLPGWLHFVVNTFNGVPSNSDINKYDICVIATDTYGASNSTSFTIKVSHESSQSNSVVDSIYFKIFFPIGTLLLGALVRFVLSQQSERYKRCEARCLERICCSSNCCNRETIQRYLISCNRKLYNCLCCCYRREERRHLLNVNE